MVKKILILTGGNVSKIESFSSPAKDLGVSVTLASFSDVNYEIANKKINIRIKNKKLSDFDVIYFRMIGKRLEEATLVARYAKQNKIPIVDRLYTKSLLMPSTIAKAIEMQKLSEKGVTMPETIFGSLQYLSQNASKQFGFPFIIKSTTGQKAREVWMIKNKKEMEEFEKIHLPEQTSGALRFFAQKFVKSVQRYRLFVLNNQVLAVLVMPTKWRKTIIDPNQDPEPVKGMVESPNKQMVMLALQAAKAAGLSIAGVDILEEKDTNKYYVIEANAAPVWKAVSKWANIDVETKILKYLSKLK